MATSPFGTSRCTMQRGPWSQLEPRHSRLDDGTGCRKTKRLPRLLRSSRRIGSRHPLGRQRSGSRGPASEVVRCGESILRKGTAKKRAACTSQMFSPKHDQSWGFSFATHCSSSWNKATNVIPTHLERNMPDTFVVDQQDVENLHFGDFCTDPL